MKWRLECATVKKLTAALRHVKDNLVFLQPHLFSEMLSEDVLLLYCSSRFFLCALLPPVVIMLDACAATGLEYLLFTYWKFTSSNSTLAPTTAILSASACFVAVRDDLTAVSFIRGFSLFVSERRDTLGRCFTHHTMRKRRTTCKLVWGRLFQCAKESPLATGLES